MAGEAWTAVLAFVGGLSGAGLGFLAASRETTHRDAQGRREEWGRRFTSALNDVSSDSPRRRTLGRVVLVRLSRSALASPEERALADAVLEAGARIEPDGELLAPAREGIIVDNVEFEEDTEGDKEDGG